MKTLTQIFDEPNLNKTVASDKGSYYTHPWSSENIAHNYTPIYDEIMTPYRHSKINFLEIGVGVGDSFRAFNEYFTDFTYYGIDVVDRTYLGNEKAKIFIGDANSQESLSSLKDNFPMFRFIIDDGGHADNLIINALGVYFPYLESGGYYILEDLHVVDKTEIYNLVDKKFQSKYLSQEQTDYINSNIDFCYFERDEKLCIIKKK